MQPINIFLFAILLLAPVAFINGDEETTAAPVAVPDAGVADTSAVLSAGAPADGPDAASGSPVQESAAEETSVPQEPVALTEDSVKDAVPEVTPAQEVVAEATPAQEVAPEATPAQEEPVAETTAQEEQAAETPAPEVSVAETVAPEEPVPATEPAVAEPEVEDNLPETSTAVTSRPLFSTDVPSDESTIFDEDSVNATSVAYHSTGTFWVAPIVLFALVQ